MAESIVGIDARISVKRGRLRAGLSLRVSMKEAQQLAARAAFGCTVLAVDCATLGLEPITARVAALLPRFLLRKIASKLPLYGSHFFVAECAHPHLVLQLD